MLTKLSFLVRIDLGLKHSSYLPARVAFNTVGTKTLILQYANLEKVDDFYDDDA